MMKILKGVTASAATLLAAGCVAYPYYDDPYYSGGYSGRYAYSAPPQVTYAPPPPPTVTYYYDYNYSPPARYYYREGRRHYERDDDHRGERDEHRGRYWDDRR